MRKWISRILFVVSIILLSISLYFLMGMYLQDQKSETGFDSIRQIHEEQETNDNKDDIEGDSNSPAIVDPGLLALHEKNPDCIGWIKIEGTAIDYPVMYHPEEENYYLKRDFNGEYNANGCLFISEACNPDTCDNLIIYGHHMNSGKMFAALEGYKEQDFYEGHPLIIYNTLHGEETYQVMASFCTPVYTGKDFAYYAFTETENEKAYQSFVDAVRKRSIYDTGITAVYGDKLLTLSTCEYSQKNGRMVVVAKKIKA
ncbi:MAG: class B sortase [Dorea sp.]|nr:class B sortase [Dorea sp.]